MISSPDRDQPPRVPSSPRRQSVAFILLVACSRGGPAAGRSADGSSPNFELICRASNTSTDSKLFCMRHDTRTGDVKRVAIDALPVSRGSTGSGQAAAGTYQLTCESTQTATRSDVYCVRLNKQNGEMLLVALPSVGVVPEEAAPPSPAPGRSPGAVRAPAPPPPVAPPGMPPSAAPR